jgi:hypothetical protein
LRSVTFALFSPKPIGVSSGPFSATRVSRIEAIVSGGHAARQAALEHLGASLVLLPGDLHARGVDDRSGRGGDLGADAVAGDHRHALLTLRIQLVSHVVSLLGGTLVSAEAGCRRSRVVRK